MNSRTLRIFLVGEGPSDIGGFSDSVQYRHRDDEGFLQPILRRLAGKAYELEFEGKKITTLPRKPVLGGKGLQERKAAQAALLALFHDCPVVVFAVDVDREPGRKRSEAELKARIEDLRGSILSGFAKAEEGNPELRAVKKIPATPCRMIESWALGDPEGLRAACGELPEEPPKDPEETWGREKDPLSGHPKCVLRRIAGATPISNIAEHSRPSEIERTCPRSFGPFARRMREVLQNPDR